MDSNAVANASLTLAGTIAGGFFALVNKQNQTHAKLAIAIDKMAQSSKEVATATKKSASEAELRNGRLGDLVSQGNELTGKILVRLEDSATTLVTNTKEAATAVRGVKSDLIESNK